MIIIGRCKELYNDDKLPSINDMISQNPIAEKGRVLNYMKNGNKGSAAAGVAMDIIKNIPIEAEFCCYNDGIYGWRSDTIYYFENYNLKLDEDFLKHVLR